MIDIGHLRMLSDITTLFIAKHMTTFSFHRHFSRSRYLIKVERNNIKPSEKSTQFFCVMQSHLKYENSRGVPRTSTLEIHLSKCGTNAILAVIQSRISIVMSEWVSVWWNRSRHIIMSHVSCCVSLSLGVLKFFY